MKNNINPSPLVSRDTSTPDTIIKVKDQLIGGHHLTVIAGPCAVESRHQMLKTAQAVKAAGATLLRGGAYKPRSSPYSFQGLEEQGLRLLQEAGMQVHLPTVSEVISVETFDLVEKYIDVLQIGTRNMQNYPLLKRAGKSSKPILLKRGMSSTIEELLMAAEYIMSAGNPNIILCERGIRTFETYTRNTLDLSAVLAIKRLSHLPIIVDPSHATGRHEMIGPLAKAAIITGAHGVMIEVHCTPEEALCDGPQSLKPQVFHELMGQIKVLHQLNL